MGRTTSATIGGDGAPPGDHQHGVLRLPPKHGDRGDGNEEVADGNAGAHAATVSAARPENATGRKSTGEKKKGERAAPDEEDLDKILAEIGQAPVGATPMPTTAPAGTASTPASKTAAAPASAPVAADVDRAVDDVNDEEMDAEMAAESAAAKRRKRKKEKGKERKAAAKVVEVDVKKPPKHVQEMLEALARRKKAEEWRQQEEEQRKRKADEEWLRQQGVERITEVVKKQKKEREKEKLQKKMQEGKTMTRKQKEEAKRLEAMRRQLLGQSGLTIVSASDHGSGGALERKKRPIYDSKKKRLQPKAGKTSEGGVDHEQELNEASNEEKECVIVKAKENIELDQEVEGAKPVKVNEDDDQWDDKLCGEDNDDDMNVTDTIDFEGDAKTEKKEAMEPVIEKVVSLEGLKNSETEDGDNVDEDGKGTRGFILKNGPAKVDITKKDMVLRSPICCILGHVDTGKTKLLDRIRGTNVQGGEAGGITQQIGATYFPVGNIRETTKELKPNAALHVPGLLVIDTPGHASFTNLRSRGSSLCDIAILVVDIMHGVQSQTIESLKLLKKHKTDFIVALNKVDRLFGWKKFPNAPIKKALKQQTEDVKKEFDARLTDILTQFKMQGINTVLYYRSRNMDDTFKNIVPTCAISGEGIPDLLLLSVQWAQKKMKERLTFCDKVECTVLDVKVTEGHGTTIDVVLANGVLHEGDQIVICGMQGPIETHIRALLTPHPMRELRVKCPYQHHKEIKATQGIKISAPGLEHSIAGTGLYVVQPGDDREKTVNSVLAEMTTLMNQINKNCMGVYVQASTLGSLEALIDFLKSPAVNIPVCDFNIGPVHKKDVMKASVMLEKKKEYAVILAFDVKVMPDAQELANEFGVKIFVADIIYHLFDQFTTYIEGMREIEKNERTEEAVFPCILKVIPDCVFNLKNPIVLGVDVLEGLAKVGTPLCIPSKDFVSIGKITSIQNSHKQVDVARKGQKVAIKIVGTIPDEQKRSFGRSFGIDDELVSSITRKSIDILKEKHQRDLTLGEWELLGTLKHIFRIP